jgi:hypothetical protein
MRSLGSLLLAMDADRAIDHGGDHDQEDHDIEEVDQEARPIEVEAGDHGISPWPSCGPLSEAGNTVGM